MNEPPKFGGGKTSPNSYSRTRARRTGPARIGSGSETAAVACPAENRILPTGTRWFEAGHRQGPLQKGGEEPRPWRFGSTTSEPESVRARTRRIGAVSHQDAFGRIVASLHEAARGDALWPATSAMIDEVCRTKGNMLTFRDVPAEDEVQIFYTRFCFRGQRDRELEHEYFGVYFPSDERIPRLTQLPDSQLVHVTDLYSYPERRTSMAYNEALARGKCQNGLNVRLDGPDDSHIVWAIADPVERCWSSDQIGVIERLLPHLRQFVLVRHALADALALGTSLTGLLDNTHAGVIQLDRRGGIVAANDRAMNVLLRREGLVDQGGFLRATSPADDSGLQRLLAPCIAAVLESGRERLDDGGPRVQASAPGAAREPRGRPGDGISAPAGSRARVHCRPEEAKTYRPGPVDGDPWPHAGRKRSGGVAGRRQGTP